MRDYKYKYSFKLGVQPFAERELGFQVPVDEGRIIADLLTGHRCVVQLVYKARPTEKVDPRMPDAAIQTWPIAALSSEELAGLRKRENYAPTEFSRAFDDVVLL